LSVRNLRTRFATDRGTVRAVNGVSFDLEEGEILGLVGESGSGKSVTALSIMRLLAPDTSRVTGSVRLAGRELLRLDDDEMSRVRGNEIAMIFQEPMTSMNPVLTVGVQIAESLVYHRGLSWRQARIEAIRSLDRVRIPSAASRYDEYPHRFSGGMRQRAMIAMALSLEPELIIADEPTTALDATVQAQILDLLLRLQQESGTALIMITHDLGVVADIADDVMVMYAGRAAEKAPKRDIFYTPHHPYTKGLLESIPSSSAAGERLRPIPGTPPSLINLPSGCKFNPRCGYVLDRCLTEEPVLQLVGTSGLHTSACWLPKEAAGLSDKAEELRAEMVREERGELAAEVVAAAGLSDVVGADDDGSAALWRATTMSWSGSRTWSSTSR
ncbi:MAG: peptide transporter ATP-binding protein, partial [Actinomycetia bacterium]|nr:peptide transporter ATP-binding protein [Actinomycetes bacterium]